MSEVEAKTRTGSSCACKSIVICGIISLIIGGCVLLGAYLPNRLFNQRALSATCIETSFVHEYYCRFGVITRMCYDAFLETSAVPKCGSIRKIGTFESRSLAEQALAQYRLPYKFACYYDPNDPCHPTKHLADTHGALWAGVVFTCLGTLFFAIWIGAFVYRRRHRDKREYESIGV